MKILRFFASLSLLIGLEAAILLFNYWRDIENHLLMYAHMQQTALSGALDSYQRMLEVIHAERFNLSSTKALLIKAAQTDAEELEQIRGELLNRYQNTFS
ncbi:MAG: hypothetical protein P8101_19315, partial [Candidatus Thiodiazotropha sp.]